MAMPRLLSAPDPNVAPRASLEAILRELDNPSEPAAEPGPTPFAEILPRGSGLFDDLEALCDRLKQDYQARRDSDWQRHSFTLPDAQARRMAYQLFMQYPKAKYASFVESWKILPSGEASVTFARRP